MHTALKYRASEGAFIAARFSHSYATAAGILPH